MGRPSSHLKSSIPNKTNGDVGGGPGGDEQEEEDVEEEPPRRTTRLRTKAAAATVPPTAVTTVAASEIVEPQISVDKEVVSDETVKPLKKRKKVSRELRKRASRKREPKSDQLSSESDNPSAPTEEAPIKRRSQRVVPPKLCETLKGVGRKRHVDSDNDDVTHEETHLFDCCFIRVSGQVYRRWKDLKKRLAFSRDEQLVVYLLDQQSEICKDDEGTEEKKKTQKFSKTIDSEENANIPNAKPNGHQSSSQMEVEIKPEILNHAALSPDASETKNLKEPSLPDQVQINAETSKPTGKRQQTEKTVGKKPKEEANLKCETEFKNDSDIEDEEKKLKRNKFSRFDCRKTPSDGIPDKPSTTGLHGRLSTSDPYNDDKDGSDSSSPLQRNTEDDDNWCRHCDKRHLEGRNVGCPLTKPLVVVSDAVIDFSAAKATEVMRENESNDDDNPKVAVTQTDYSKSFAQLSLPSILELCSVVTEKSEDSKTNCLFVIARVLIKAFTQFGPLQGELMLEQDIPEEFDMKDLWQVFTSQSSKIYLSTANPEKSNWFRYVRPAPTRKQRNVATLVKDDQLFLVNIRDLDPGDEILFWMDDPHLMWTKTRADKKNCGGCNLKFSHPLYYRSHCSVFHDPAFSLTIRKYHCKICGIALLGKENIVQHAASKHGGRGAYQCQFCKKFFLRLNYLEMHRTYGCSSNPSRTRPLCHLCGKKFCQPQKLKIHMKRMHSGDKAESLVDFQCPICGKMLATRNAALRHRKEVHSEVIDGFENSLLDTSLLDNSSLLLDNSSIGESDGGEQSTEGSIDPSKQLLASSILKVHCPKCPKTFKNKSNLKIHMLTHSGVKPFGCKIEGCKSGFTTKQCLQFHYRKSHGLTDEEMPKIEREIPYTLSAYSGEMLDNKKINNKQDQKKPDKEKTVLSLKRPLSTGESLRSIRKCDVMREEEVDDVYTFHDNEEQPGQVFPEDEAPVFEKKSVPKKSVDDVINVSDRTSLLVVAALCAAEQDLKASGTSLHEDRELETSPTDDTVKSTHEFESSPQSKDPELTPEEEVNPDLVAEGGFSEANYSLGEVISNREAVASVEPPPAASTPHQNDSMLPSSEPQQSNSGYDSYLVGPPPVSPFSRRSPVFPSSSLFQSNSSSMMQQRETVSYPQHPASAFPFGPPGAHGPPSSHLYHPGLDIASRYSNHFRNSSDPYSNPYSRSSFSHSHSDFSLPPSEAFYGDASTGSIDLSSHGVTSGSPSSSPIVTTSSSSLFSHHAAASMMMINEHLLNVNSGARGDSPSPAANPDLLSSPFSRGMSKTSDSRYHPHPPPQSYYPHSNPSSRFPPSPGPYPPPGSRLPHLGQSGPPPPYHYGYF